MTTDVTDRLFQKISFSKGFHSKHGFSQAFHLGFLKGGCSLQNRITHVELRSFCKKARFVGKSWAGQCQRRRPDRTGRHHGIKKCWHGAHVTLFVCVYVRESENMWSLVHDAYFRFLLSDLFYVVVLYLLWHDDEERVLMSVLWKYWGISDEDEDGDTSCPQEEALKIVLESLGVKEEELQNVRKVKGVRWTLGIETFLCPRSAIPRSWPLSFRILVIGSRTMP